MIIRRVQELFDEFEGADNRSRQRIADQILTELEIHATLEETLTYPAIREAVDEDDMMDEALKEHYVVKVMIKELRKMQRRDERYLAKFKVLNEIVKHRVKEEESEILPQAEQTDLDFKASGLTQGILRSGSGRDRIPIVLRMLCLTWHHLSVLENTQSLDR